MLQTVLSIDTTCEPNKICVIEFDGRKIEVIESKEIAAQTESQELPDQTTQSHNLDQLAIENSPFKNALKELKSNWSSAILVVPSKVHLTLNLDLPFSDPKKINKILPSEIQDLVPFEVNDFLVSSKILIANTSNSAESQVHVSLAPRQQIKDVLATCKNANIEPVIIAPISSILAGAYEIAPEYFSKNSCLIWAEEPNYCMCLSIDGQVVQERVVAAAKESVDSVEQQNEDLEGARQDFLINLAREFRLTIAAAERRYSKSFDTIYVFADEQTALQIQIGLGRSVELVKLSEFIKNQSQISSISVLGAIYALPANVTKILTNYRVGDFAYSPQLKEVLAGIKSLLPYIFATLISFVLATSIIYFMRASRLEKLQEQLQSQVNQFSPDANYQSGLEVAFIQGRIRELEQSLRDLGSLSKLSPLDSFLEISKTLPEVNSDISIYNVNIKDNRIRLKGNAALYQHIDNLEKGIKANKSAFCEVTRKDSTAQGISSNSKLGFEFIISICE